MENQDPSTSLGSASFGLIDEKLLRDTTASLINVSSDEKRVTDKPPKPFRTPTSIDRLGGSQEELKIAPASEEEDDENDETQTTVHLDEEMANELIDDDQVYSSSSSDVEEEDDQYIDKENNRPTHPRQFALSVNKSNFSNTQLNDLTNVSSANFYDFDEHRFKPANNETCYVSNLMDESSNILRNSAEFDTTTDKMNRSNENGAAAANGKSPTKRRSTSAASSKPAKSRYLYDDDSRFVDENEVKLQVKSNAANEQEQPKVDFDQTRQDRLSQIIQHAIERRKQSHSQYDEVGNDDLKAIYDKLSIRTETKEIEKKLMDTSINANNYSNWQLNDQSILKEQNGENDRSLLNASKPSDQTYQIDKKEKNTIITTANKPGSTTMIEGELPSMYFKPGSDESLRFSNQSSTYVAAANTASQLPTQNPFDFAEDQMAMQAQAFMQCSGFGIGAEDTAGFRDAEQCLADLANDEAQNRKEFADNNLTIDQSHSTTHIISTSSSSSSSDETSNSKRRDADQKLKNAENGEKKEKWWLNANQVLQTSKLELSASSINSSDWMDSSVSSGSSAANAHNSQRPLVKIPAVEYFSKRSTMPDICQAESDVDINATVRSDDVNRAMTDAPPVNDPSTTRTINLNDSQDKTICEDKGNRPETAIQTPRQKASGDNNEDDTTNITFSSLATPGQTTRDNFSFTFNTDPEKGPFLLEKPKKPLVLSPMEPVKEPKQAKTTATTTTTSTSTLNFKTLQNELENVSNRLASSDRTKPTIEKESKKSTTTPSSFTSTPTRLPKSHGGNREENKGDRDSSSRSSVSNAAASNKADLFNQESFLSSIPAGDDTTLLSSSIHRMHRKLRQKNTSNVQSSTAISSPTKQSSSRHHHSHHNKHSKSSNQRVGIVDEQDDENDESNNRLTLTSVSSAAVSSTSGSGASGGGIGAVGSSAVSSSTASPSETLTNSANSLHLHRSASQVSSGNIMPNYMTNTNMGPVMYVPFVPLNSQFLQQPSAAAAASNSHHMAAHMSAMASVNGSLVTPNIPGSNLSSFAGGFSSAPTLPSHHPSFLSAPNQPHSHLYQTPPTTDIYGNTPTTSYSSLGAQQQTHVMMRQQLSNSNMSLTSNFLPKIEFEPANVDFGPIAEGCFTQLVVFLKLMNLEALSNLESASIEVELMSAPDWAIEPVEAATTDSTTRQSKSANLLLKKLNKDVIRCALDQTLSLVNSTDSPKSDGANKLTFGPLSRYHQFYVRLDTRNLNMIRDLVAQLDAAAVEMLEPIRIQTYALVHLILGPPHALKRYSLDRIELRFVLGYAKLRSSEEIEFTLPSDKAAASSGSNQPIISEQVVTLTNIGNVHVDVDCFLTSTSSNASSLSSKKHAQQSIRFGEFELRVDEALLSLAPRAQSRQSTRLLLMHRLQHKGEDDRIARLSTPTIDPADLDGVRLMFEVSPSGAKHVIPIKFKLPEKRIKAPRISSNRTILFFGSTLNPSSRSNTDMGTGLHDEFAICNPNKIRCTYKLSVVEEPEGSFTFVLVDKVCKAPTRLTPQCNELEVVLEPGMEIRIGVRFNRYNIDQDIVVGSIRIEVREGEEKQGFCMELVGFQFETALDVVDSRSRMSDKRSSQEAASTNKSLLEKLKYRSTKYSKLSLDLLGSSRSHSYKKHVQLKNKSSIFKCIVYPVLFDTRSGKEIQLAMAPKKSQIAEIAFDLSEGARLRLAALDRMINFNDGMVWIELKKGEEAGIQIEYSSNNASAGDRIDTVRLCFFYSEYDLAAYAAYNYVQSNSRNQTAARDKEFIDVLTSRLLFNSELMQNGELLCSNSMNESTVSRLNYKPSSTFANAAANVSMNCSTMSEDTTIVNVNTSTLMTRLGTKPRHFREDYLRLFRQSIKCTFLMLSLAQNDQLMTNSSSLITNIDEKRTRLPAITSTTSDSNLLSRRSETLAISSMMSKKPSDQQHRSSLSSDDPPALSSAQESWTLTPSQLRLSSSSFKTITISNKLLRKQLEYHVKFRPEYLVVEPSKGTLNELGFTELQVRVAPSAAATLRDTWQGTISVWCNLVQKDVRVTIEVPSQIGQTSIIEQKREFDASTPASSTIRRRGSTFEPDSIEPCVEMPSSLSNGGGDLEPSSIDSLMALTPLITASLTPRFINSFSTTALSSTNSSSLASVTPLSSSSASSFSKDFTSSFSYGVKMQKMSNNENCWMVNFPPVQLHQTHSFEITLTNPTPLYVNWKAFSEGPATIKLDDIDKSCASASSSSSSTLSLFENVVKSSCAAFSMSPQSGSIPPMKTQMIRLAFSPRQACGLYQQTWFVETRADASSVSSMFDSKSSSSLHSFSTISRTDYQCKIMLNGKAVSFTDSLSRPKDESTNRLPKDSDSRSSKGMLSQTNSSMSSILSSSASTTSSQKSSNLKEGLHFKSNVLKFGKVAPNEKVRLEMEIKNHDEFNEHKLSVVPGLQPPFFVTSRHAFEVNVIQPKHFIRIPVDFRPQVPGRYKDKILVKTDQLSNPNITCELNAECAP